MHREKEADCFNRLRVLNRRKAVVRARARVIRYLEEVIQMLSRKLEKEPSREVQGYIRRLISQLESNIAMLEMANRKNSEEIEAEEQRWYEECAEVVHYALQKFVPERDR